MPALDVDNASTRKVSRPAYGFCLCVKDPTSALRLGLLYCPAVVMPNDKEFFVFSHIASLMENSKSEPRCEL